LSASSARQAALLEHGTVVPDTDMLRGGFGRSRGQAYPSSSKAPFGEIASTVDTCTLAGVTPVSDLVVRPGQHARQVPEFQHHGPWTQAVPTAVKARHTWPHMALTHDRGVAYIHVRPILEWA
jgi:hypothetical protein